MEDADWRSKVLSLRRVGTSGGLLYGNDHFHWFLSINMFAFNIKEPVLYHLQRTACLQTH